MPEQKNVFEFRTDGVFSSCWAANFREIYMPLCGPDSESVKSSITPFLSGDIKINKSKYLTKPVSRQDLRGPLRNFFIRTSQGDIFSIADRETDDSVCVEAGQLWHKVINRSEKLGLQMTAVNFVPVTNPRVELMKVTVKNDSVSLLKITPIGCIPLFARSLVNKHDHEHVTSLLHRTSQIPEGILVSPTMIFNEEGHQEAAEVYFVIGADADGSNLKGSFPTVDSFLGDSGTFEWPEAVAEGWQARSYSAEEMNGKEVAGALCFAETDLAPGEVKEYILCVGTAASLQEVHEAAAAFNSADKFDSAFEASEKFWLNKSAAIELDIGDEKFKAWMKWVMLQPIFRRIFGCSFLPDHDYGKGGKGWRDLWQDLLSLILIEPETVRRSLINNFGGVRIDGSNATIIGNEENEFIADRNAITRVWMDHGTWPVLTIMLYIDQTGDTDILFEKTAYFRDLQISRTIKKDKTWNIAYGRKLKTHDGGIYQGTVLEHMLVQTLTQFFNVGEHHMMRLESADWNDGLDMAFHRGESVAFSSFYASNLNALADLLEYLETHQDVKTLTFFKEILILLDSFNGTACDYENIDAKRHLLFEDYFGAVEPEISGGTVDIDIKLLIGDLRHKAQWLTKKIREQERVSVEHEGRTFSWFNGYYDNQGKRVEGSDQGRVRMTLTGQVFAIMSGVADDETVKEIVQSADHFLKDQQHGGHRLNTDFGLDHYLDLGRAFSFAYGTKENGAVFCHMTVMYAFALYRRGFVREGFKVLDALYRMAVNIPVSKIYPNIPEYFDSAGRGMYSYLTGSASWLILTLLTQSFGVRGEKGDLTLEPKLVSEQFSGDGTATATSIFAGKVINVSYHNPDRLDCSEYRIFKLTINGNDKSVNDSSRVILKRSLIQDIPEEVNIDIHLKKAL